MKHLKTFAHVLINQNHDPAMNSPRFFISYSHDSAAHRGFVLSLANQLRREGLDGHDP